MRGAAWAISLVSLAAAFASGVGCRDGGGDDDVGELLSGKEAKALFADHTVKGHHHVHGYDFKSYYEPDGAFRSYQDGDDEPRKGKWWVAGDELCIRWIDPPPQEKGKGAGEDLCRRIEQLKSGTYRKVHLVGKGGAKRKLLVTYESFDEGNPDDL